MTTSTSRLSYSDAFEVWEKAKDDPKGIRIQFPTEAAAKTFMARLHEARKIDRRDNTQVYEEGDPLFGRSVYDPFLVRRPRPDPEDKWWLYIEPCAIGTLVIESLSEMEDAAE